MKIAILGYSRQGQSAYEYWNTSDNELTICDQNPATKVPKGAKAQLGDNYLANLDEFDVLVRTPALHPRDIVAANPDVPGILDKVTTNTNEFFRACPTKHIIGVTGTKGKGTTSTLIAKILEADGKRVHLGGNIGIAPLEMLKNDIEGEDWVVLELANFQLIDLKHSPYIAVCLMVAPEHLDWHEDVEEYYAAKQQLFINQDETDIAIYYAQNETSLSIADASIGVQIPYMQAPGATIDDMKLAIEGREICSVEDFKLLGRHNWQNICAALTAVWPVTQNIGAMRAVITTFTGLEHRLELVKEVDDVRYYDDSFGTTPETAMVAIQAFEQPKVVILGGSDKGATYDALAKTVKTGNVRKVIVIGDTGPSIKAALKAMDFTNVIDGPDTMPAIIELAHQSAQPGDVVLLSTACASFGLFQDYKDRGEQFQAAVKALDRR